MKPHITTLFGAAIFSAFCAAAPAYAIPVIDTVDPTDTLITFGITPDPCPAGFTCVPGALSFVHNITDNGFTVGDTINSATIDIHLTEQTTTGVNNETYRYDIATQTFSCLSGNCVPNPGVTDSNIPLTASSLADLVIDGIITITVNALSGNFLFADSILTAQVVDTSQVPIPSTLLLLGSVLLVSGWRLRRLN